MNDNLLKKLVNYSYTKEVLDKAKVEEIAGKLKRFELKKYINFLKNMEQRKSIFIAIPSLPSPEMVLKIKDVYLNKQVKFVVDPKLMVGIKVINNNEITEYNLKNMLDLLLKRQN